MTSFLHRWFNNYDYATGRRRRLFTLVLWLVHIVLIFGGMIANNLLVVMALWTVLVWGWHLRWEYKNHSTTITMSGSHLARVGDTMLITIGDKAGAFIVASVNSDTTVTVVPKK